MRCDINNETLKSRWDQFVKSSPQVCPFATTAWCNALKQSLDIESDIVTATKGEDILAGLVTFFRKRSGKKVPILPPLTPYTPFVYRPVTGSYPSKITFEHISVTRSLINRLKSEYSNSSHLLLPSTLDVRPWIWTGWKAIPHYTYILDLNRELRLSHAIRKQVNKGNRSGFTLEVDWSLDAFWNIFSKTQRRQNFAIDMGKIQFCKLANLLHESGITKMITALSPDKNPIASRIEIFLPESDTCYDWVAGSDPDYLTTGVNPWLMVRVIGIMNEQGFNKWDLCGAGFETIARFKGEFGGELTLYFQIDSPLSPFKKAWQTLKRYFE